VSVAVAVLLPLVTALLASQRGVAASVGRRLAPFAAAALLLPLASGERVRWSWALLGLDLGVDTWGGPFVVLTAVAWGLAAWFAAERVSGDTRRFWLGWSLSLWGMTLVLLSQSLVSFYLGYVAVSLAAYLMIVHARTEAAWRAGRVYLLLAFAGEAAIVSGVLILAGFYGNVELALLATPEFAAGTGAARWWLLAGFAVKLGIMPLHVWLPLAHPIAPVPASAILSGVIVKAGALGWLKLAPSAGLDVSAAAPALVALGLVTAFAAVAIGVTQRGIKTALAYSTISQMGLLLVAYAALTLQPSDQRALAVIGLFALHHGLTKAALFLACGCAPAASALRRALLGLSTLSLAAAPLTSGYLAKVWLKRSLSAGIELGALPELVYPLVTLTSAATALLMWRVWRLAHDQRDDAASALHPAWPLLALSAALLPWWWGLRHGLAVGLNASALWDAAWPLALAAALVLAWRTVGRPGLRLPEGDLVVLFERFARVGRPAPLEVRLPARRTPRPRQSLRRLVTLVERSARELPAVGSLLLLAALATWWALRG